MSQLLKPAIGIHLEPGINLALTEIKGKKPDITFIITTNHTGGLPHGIDKVSSLEFLQQKVSEYPESTRFNAPGAKQGQTAILCLAAKKNENNFQAIKHAINTISGNLSISVIQKIRSYPLKSPNPIAIVIFPNVQSNISELLNRLDPDNQPESAVRIEEDRNQPATQGLIIKLDDTYYAIQQPIGSNNYSVTWTAHPLHQPPDDPDDETLLSNSETRQRLINDHNDGKIYKNLGNEDIVAIQIAIPGFEENLQKYSNNIRRLGSYVAQVRFSNLISRDTAEASFPCLIFDWFDGICLRELPAQWSEHKGLWLCAQITHLLQIAHLANPDLQLTSGITIDNIFLSGDETSKPRVKMLEWGYESVDENNQKEQLVIRFGELMLQIFCPVWFQTIIRSRNTLSWKDLGIGSPDSLPVQEWDKLSYGTRTIIRRLLSNDLGGNSEAILQALYDLISEQIECWLSPNPLVRAQIESSGSRLNWLDIAGSQGDIVPSEERQQIIFEIADSMGKQDYHSAALIDLRTALRLYPEESGFRWATLVHTVANLSRVPHSYVRLRLSDTLEAMRERSFELAEAFLESRRAHLPRLDPDHPELAGKLVTALSYRIKILRLIPPALTGVQNDWRVEEAESVCSVVQDIHAKAEQFENEILGGTDQACEHAIKQLQFAIADYYSQQADYNAITQSSELLLATRQKKFEQRLIRARRLGELARESQNPDILTEAMIRYDRTAEEFPDLWETQAQILETERLTFRNQYIQQRAAFARQFMQQERFAEAAQALRPAMDLFSQNDLGTSTMSVLQAFQQAMIYATRQEYSLAEASINYVYKTAWLEIQPLLESWKSAFYIGSQIQQAREEFIHYHASATHMAHIINLTTNSIQQAKSWHGPIWLETNVQKWEQEAIDLTNKAVNNLVMNVDDVLCTPHGNTVLYNHYSYLNIIKAIKNALTAIETIRPVLDTELTRLAAKLNASWRKTLAIYQYDRTNALILAGIYVPAIVAGSDADEARSNDPQVADRRKVVSEVVFTELIKVWKLVFDNGIEQKSLTKALRNAFANFSDPNLPIGQLDDLGNRFLQPGLDVNIATQALEYWLSSEPKETKRDQFAKHLASYRPQDDFFYLFHYASVGKLVSNQQYEDAELIAETARVLQRDVADIIEQRREAQLAVETELCVYWAHQYYITTKGGPIAQPILDGLNRKGLSTSLVNLAVDLMEPGVLDDNTILNLAEFTYAGLQAKNFADTIAKFRPDQYPTIREEWQNVLAGDTIDRLNQIREILYAPKNLTGASRLNLWYAFTYIYSSQRIRKVNELLIFTKRIAPNEQLYQQVRLMRLRSWLAYILVFCLIVVLLVILWILIG